MKLLNKIWSQMSFCVTNKVKINALYGYSTFVTDETSQNTLYLLRRNSITCLTIRLPTLILC